MTFYNPYIILIGGNTGNWCKNDVWILKINKVPFSWKKINLPNAPCPRVYFSICLNRNRDRADMIYLFGGRDN